MPEEKCPGCGCEIGENAWEKDGKTYCCQPCADEESCICGCCDESVLDEAEDKAQAK